MSAAAALRSDAPLEVQVLRGSTVESTHAVALAVVDAQGAVQLVAGDIDRPVFPRSAVKLLQALPLVESGAADALGLTDAELALACASHNGEEAHVQGAAGMLAKAGLDTDALECGTHWPYFEPAARALAARGAQPCALHNNCSGKHAGFLCLAHAMSGGTPSALRGFARGYVEPEHPVMREVSAATGRMAGVDLARLPRGTDGCSIPSHAMPLRALARAYARVASGEGLPDGTARAAQRLRRAAASAPFMGAGTGRFDTQVLEYCGERVYLKVGAEGVYCAAFPERGLGLALKVADGQTRAADLVMAHALGALLERRAGDDDFLAPLLQPVLRNWQGREVAALRLATPIG